MRERERERERERMRVSETERRTVAWIKRVCYA